MTNRTRDQQAAATATLDRSSSAPPRRDLRECSPRAWAEAARRPGPRDMRRHSQQPSSDTKAFIDAVIIPVLLERLLREHQSAA